MNKKVRFNMIITEEDRYTLKKIALDRNITMSAYVYRLLKREILKETSLQNDNSEEEL